MSIKIYDSQHKTKTDLKTLEPGKLRMYVCGVTVYDKCHLGHGRAYVAFDVIRRYLAFSGLDVTMVRNVTDIDDKIIRKAQATCPGAVENEQIKKACLDVSETFYANFLDNMKSLNVLAGDIEPKATDHIPEMLDLIGALIEKNMAYVTSDGIYFRVKDFKNYGQLSGRDTDDMISGARVDVNDEKESPLDFALWKFKKEGEPHWPSPWGDGRPGWHIECSAMALKHLGAEVDIHGGGEDLIFPHHENEIAQAEAATGKRFVRHWLHNGFVKINDEKMSKSLGNFLTLEGTFEQFNPKVLRFFFLSKHYKNPIDFTPELVEESSHAVKRIEQCLALVKKAIGKQPEPADRQSALEDESMQNFCAKMDDDFNTAGAVGVMFELITEINKLIDANAPKDEISRKAGVLCLMTDILGIVPEPVMIKEETSVDTQESKELGVDEVNTLLALEELDDGQINDLVQARLSFRKAKNWAMADEIRNSLVGSGILIKDTKEGSSWARQ